jgi:hypothetical protein
VEKAKIITLMKDPAHEEYAPGLVAAAIVAIVAAIITTVAVTPSDQQQQGDHHPRHPPLQELSTAHDISFTRISGIVPWLRYGREWRR